MHMLSVEGLSLRYGGQQVLDDISFSFERGKITGLLGPNGAGKSSIFKVLAGLVRPDSAVVKKNGEHLSDISNLRKSCAYMIDSPSFYPYLSGIQNLQLICRVLGVDKNLEEIMHLVGLDPLSPKRVRNYSTGMKQRLAIAQTMINDVDLLLLDEPFNGLDPNGFQDLIALLRELNAKGATIVVSSHLLNELEQFADAFILLHKGSIALDISKKDLLKLKKKVSFAFDSKPSNQAMNLISKYGGYQDESQTALLNLEPNEIARTVERLVGLGAVPVNVETQNLLESRYLEITA
ncbi:MAG: ABC transporter ATP-binding protein [Lutimonas sp.]